MSAQTPSSYTYSILLHAAAAGALFFGAVILKEQKREPAKFIELVAGEGDNYAATEASMLGDPDGMGVDLPTIPAPNVPKIAEIDPSPNEPLPIPEPEPVKPTPQPPEPDPITPAPLKESEKEKPSKNAEKAAPAKEPKAPNFVKDVTRLAKKREQRLMTKYRKEQAAKAERERKAAEQAAKRTSYDQFNKQNAGKTNASQSTASVRKGLRGGVEQGTGMAPGAGGKALTAAEASLMERYYSFLKLKLRQAHEPPPGVGDRLSTEIEFFLAADGTMSQLQISRSSGNTEFDESVLAAFRKVRSVGPRPDGQSERVKLRFNAQDDE
jgi:colicin import membrane protein